MMAKTKKKTWDDVFNRHLDKGMDHADAAYRADQWERQRARQSVNAPIAPEGKTDG